MYLRCFVFYFTAVTLSLRGVCSVYCAIYFSFALSYCLCFVYGAFIHHCLSNVSNYSFDQEVCKLLGDVNDGENDVEEVSEMDS